MSFSIYWPTDVCEYRVELTEASISVGSVMEMLLRALLSFCCILFSNANVRNEILEIIERNNFYRRQVQPQASNMLFVVSKRWSLSIPYPEEADKFFIIFSNTTKICQAKHKIGVIRAMIQHRRIWLLTVILWEPSPYSTRVSPWALPLTSRSNLPVQHGCTTSAPTAAKGIPVWYQNAAGISKWVKILTCPSIMVQIHYTGTRL